MTAQRAMRGSRPVLFIMAVLFLSGCGGDDAAELRVNPERDTTPDAAKPKTETLLREVEVLLPKYVRLLYPDEKQRLWGEMEKRGGAEVLATLRYPRMAESFTVALWRGHGYPGGARTLKEHWEFQKEGIDVTNKLRRIGASLTESSGKGTGHSDSGELGTGARGCAPPTVRNGGQAQVGRPQAPVGGARGEVPEARANEDRTLDADGRVLRRLEQALPTAQLDKVEFGDALGFLTDVSGVSMCVNWGALQAVGIDRTSPVTVHVLGATVGDALRLTLALVSDALPEDAPEDFRLGYIVHDGVVTISTRRDLRSGARTASPP